jgi:hypothetical protein
MTQRRQALVLIHGALEKKQIPHALAGSFALLAYGHLQDSNTLELLVDGSLADAADQIKSCLVDLGFSLNEESKDELHFSWHGFSVQLLLAEKPRDLEMLGSAATHATLNVNVLKPEHLIVLKIQSYKKSPTRKFLELSEIQLLLQTPDLDLGKVKHEAELLGEWEQLKLLMLKEIEGSL